MRSHISNLRERLSSGIVNTIIRQTSPVPVITLASYHLCVERGVHLCEEIAEEVAGDEATTKILY
jgi:hypothetical protein